MALDIVPGSIHRDASVIVPSVDQPFAGRQVALLGRLSVLSRREIGRAHV